MRRIFTSTIFVAALAVASFNSNAQACHASTSNPLSPAIPGTPGFGATFSINASEGFSGNRTPITTWPEATANTTLISPVFYYDNAQTATYFKIHLTPDGNNKAMDITSYSISVKYGAGAGVVQSCNSVPGNSITIPGTSAGTDLYFWIDGISIPAGTNFQITLTLTLGSSTGTTHNEIASAYQSNGVYRANAALPVKFQALDAKAVNSAVSLKWNVATEENLSGYSIERSTDGRNFSQISFVGASGQSDYSFVDSKPTTTAYYRIKSVDLNGRYGYSTVALVKSGKSTIVLKAFPSPVIKSVSIQHPTATAGTSISVSSADGRIMKTIVPATGMQQTEIDLSAAKAGLYLVRFNSGNGESETLKILKQ